MDTISIIYGLITTIMASTGFWAFIKAMKEKKSSEKKLLIGLAHDRIIFLGMSYVERGYITQDEYENLRKYLYEPYEEMGGNGSAKRVMDEVDTIPIYKPIYMVKEKEEKE